MELSKKLKTLGVKQESLFYWYHYKNTDGRWEIAYGTDNEAIRLDLGFSAFTVAELFKEHYERFGLCAILLKVESGKVADYLAEYTL